MMYFPESFLAQSVVHDLRGEPRRPLENHMAGPNDDGRMSPPRLLTPEPGTCHDCGHPMPPYGPDAPVGMTREQLRRAGKAACLCENCGMPLRRWKRVTPDTPRCSRCGRHVPGASPEAVSVTCCLCVTVKANMRAAGLVAPRRAERPCPDCGGPLPRRRRYCDDCAQKRARARDRTKKRKRRGAPLALSPTSLKTTLVSPCWQRAENRRFRAVGCWVVSADSAG